MLPILSCRCFSPSVLTIGRSQAHLQLKSLSGLWQKEPYRKVDDQTLLNKRQRPLYLSLSLSFVVVTNFWVILNTTGNFRLFRTKPGTVRYNNLGAVSFDGRTGNFCGLLPFTSGCKATAFSFLEYPRNILFCQRDKERENKEGERGKSFRENPVNSIETHFVWLEENRGTVEEVVEVRTRRVDKLPGNRYGNPIIESAGWFGTNEINYLVWSCDTGPVNAVARARPAAWTPLCLHVRWLVPCASPAVRDARYALYSLGELDEVELTFPVVRGVPHLASFSPWLLSEFCDGSRRLGLVWTLENE